MYEQTPQRDEIKKCVGEGEGEGGVISSRMHNIGG